MAKGRLLERAKSDWERITTVGGFEEDITFKTPDSINPTIEVTVQGLASKHNLSVDFDTGAPVNSKNAHVTVSEDLLTEAGFTVRNEKGEVALIDYKISYPDSTGVLKHYVVGQNIPDETVGVITFILNDYSD